jgi:glycosyltransferase involved in cell wall biosynthesis
VKHIVIDARLINSSTGRYIEQLLEHLQDIDEVNTYTVLVPKRDLEYWVPRNRRFSVEGFDSPPYSISEQLALLCKLLLLKPDLVHFCMPQQPVLYMGKSVTTVHDLTLLKTYNTDKRWLEFRFKQLVGRLSFAVTLRKSRRIIAVSEFTKADIVKFFRVPKERIIVTYESATPITGEPQPVDLPFKRFLLYVGRQPDYKNIVGLAETFQRILGRHPDLGLVLAGSRNSASKFNEESFRKRGFKNIHFTGRVSDRELSWLYSQGTAYVFPSYFEGFGLPGLEAMSAGLPVVSSNRTCLPEVFGDSALYFDPDSPSEFELALDQIVTDADLRAALSANGSVHAKKFSWQKMARETLAVYESSL